MFACLYVPDFAVQACLLPEQVETRIALQQSPLAILDGPANLPRVFATNPAARRAGIQTGMTKLQVETYGGVLLRKRSIAAEELAQTTLADYAGTFSPRVESACPGAVILDLAGMEKLLGPLHNTAHAMTTKAVEAGFDLRIAMASNPDTAFLAARGFSANTIISAGEEARRLAPLHVGGLPISAGMLEVLDSWGIGTFQSLAALPTVAIVERLGQEGLYLQKLARGQINRPLLTIEPNAEIVESFEFDDPVETLESLFFILNRLLQQLCSKLISAALAANELRLTVGLEVRQVQRGKAGPQGLKPASIVALSGTAEEAAEKVPSDQEARPRRLKPDSKQCAYRSALALRHPKSGATSSFSATSEVVSFPKPICENSFKHEWKLPVPTQDKNLLFGLVRLQLERTTFSAPVRKLTLEVVPVKPRVAQGNLFAPPSPEPEKLEITLERIRGVVGTTDADGADCVGSPRLVDTHKPGSFTVRHFSSMHEPSNSSPAVAPVVALRVFRPALETSVELDGEKPHFVWLWHRHRRVLAASGPWSSSGNWWNSSAWTREEWDVALKTPAGLGFYRIYRDRIRRQWFVEGVFD